MKLPMTFSLYMARQFALAILSTLAVILIIVGMMELLELIRRAGDGNRSHGFFIILEMAALKLPMTAGKIYPFVFLIGGMVALSRLTRSSELVAARAAGVSVWQFMLPGIAIAIALGVFFVSFVNPIGAAMVTRYDKMEARYYSNRPSTLSISQSGLWLRQVQDGTQAQFLGQPVHEYILNAQRMDTDTRAMQSLIVFFFDAKGNFIGRIDAPSATLGNEVLTIDHASLSLPGMVPEPSETYLLPTELTLEHIQDSFLAPEMLSFWELPGFIGTLESAGFSGLRHRLYWHSLLAQPLLLAGMVLLSAVFSLRQARRGRTGVFFVTGVVFGFLFYFASNIIYALGASGGLPVALAAWAPSLAVIALATSLLLHLEDG